MMARPTGITVLALAMIVIGALGVVANLNGYLSVDPAYPREFWLAFVGLKGLGLVGGVLLLQMRRMGVWWSLASFAIGVPVALLATGNVPAWQWVGAAAVTALILCAGWLAIRNHWHELRPHGPTLGAK
jgi:hypothetical protein